MFSHSQANDVCPFMIVFAFSRLVFTAFRLRNYVMIFTIRIDRFFSSLFNQLIVDIVVVHVSSSIDYLNVK